MNNIEYEKKDIYANLILFISATIINLTLWNALNSDFIRFIDTSFREQESAFLEIGVILFSSFLICLFLLIPVRLAHWVEESLNANTKLSRRKLRASMLFAGLGSTSPAWIELIRVYIF